MTGLVGFIHISKSIAVVFAKNYGNDFLDLSKYYKDLPGIYRNYVTTTQSAFLTTGQVQPNKDRFISTIRGGWGGGRVGRGGGVIQV